ncbi:MAG: UDP-N-acetylmuramate--L-alanine ligase [Acidobacteria bacterium]|nr:UDP-N-acetylmuramate--L-alanine ligase [Acidobacteriota bacterium]
MFGRFKTIHFVGIGGTGMSGIAEVLHNLGFSVTGSDLNQSDYTKRLESLGIKISYIHDAANVADADAVVVSTAIRRENPEWQAAEIRNIPVIPRGEMLAELMRMKAGIAISGTHGKTTTTSIAASVLSQGGLDPTVIIGGIFAAYGSNARLGSSEYLVAEADESDGSFLRLSPIYSIITNIDEDHMNYYKTMDNLKDSFVEFANKVPFFGATIVCLEDSRIKSIIPDIRRRVISYGFSAHCDYQGVDIRVTGKGYEFGVRENGEKLGNFILKVPGRHNILNTLSVIALAREMELSKEDIYKGVAAYTGTKRRSETVGWYRGCRVISDYAHHPVEIEKTLGALREFYRPGRIICIFQPHRYSRTKNQFENFHFSFHQSDVLNLLPIYPAGETPIEGISSEALVNGIRKAGHRDVNLIENSGMLPETLRGIVRDGDLVVFLGAGTIDLLARQFGKEECEK